MERTLVTMTQLDEVTPTLYRFTLGADEKDPAKMAAEVTDDFCALIYLDGELLNETRGREAMLEQVSAFFPVQQDARRHAMTNAFFEERSETHVVVCSLLAVYVISAAAAELRSTGLYHDRLVVDDGVWKLEQRILYLDCATDPGSEPPSWALQAKGEGSTSR